MIDLSRPLLVVAPHPDDEVLGCGWLMRRAQAAGARIVIAWMTDGSASHGDLGPVERAALVARRQSEARAGLAALDVVPAASYFLGFPDGGLAAHAAAAHAALAAICAEHSAATVVVTSDADGHPDHRASFDVVARLRGVVRYAYPVSGRYDGDDVAADAAIRIAGDDEHNLKRAALTCHASQQSGGGARYPMSSAAIARFCSEPEIFMSMESQP